MAGIGRAPKPREQRRNTHVPMRGEWVDLKALEKPILGQPDRDWPAHVKRAWRAWRSDPVTSQWGPADVWFAQELCRLYDELPHPEFRQRAESLGLSPKGKRDLRWRTPQEVRTIAEQPPIKRLRLAEQEKQAS